MPRIIGYGIFAAVTTGAYEYTGGTLRGYWNRSEVDDYERKEMLRKTRRRPIEETIAEIGEGRGQYRVLPPSAVCRHFPRPRLIPSRYQAAGL
jgi:hypothetical protein